MYTRFIVGFDIIIIASHLHCTNKPQSSNYIYHLSHNGLLTDVDTIQELTNILILNHGGLRDLSTGQGNLGKINTRDFNLILDIGSALVCHTIQELNTAHLLLTQKVADLHSGTDAGNVDWKVCIAEAHLVLEALGNTSNHVFDVGADSSDGSNVLSVAEPQVDLQSLATIDLLNINGNVLERSGQGTLWTLDDNIASLDLNSD